MATDSKRRLPFHRRAFLLLISLSWALVACFILFQYVRERRYKVSSLDAVLQLENVHLLDMIERPQGLDLDPLVALDMPDTLRVTVIGLDGEVLYDSYSEESGGSAVLGNHRQRPEVAAALATGAGYTIKRLSESTSERYFYSARRGHNVVMRTAVPYTYSLYRSLRADMGFLWFILAVAVVISIIGYFATRRLGRQIERLRDFAERAERGERIECGTSVARDEIDDISNHVIGLYAELQKTIGERDREHAKALHETQEKIRIKRQLTNNINHELKTPIASISGYIETIISNERMDDATRTAFLRRCLSQCERLGKLLADVADITRMDDGREQIHRERVVLNDIVDEIAEEVAVQPAERRLRVNCDFEGEVAVVGNRDMLTSIFRNLASNAVAYSSGRDIFIHMVAEDDEKYTISFADNGIGVEEEHLPRLFERFYRVDKGRSRKMGGTGLGLSIVKNAVALHGGDIEARNRVSGGLEFIFTLRKNP
ncbi:MAG: ATP-binding protein [Alistipes sp.]|nr:ATP-binding protein [Alistipes sp.]